MKWMFLYGYVNRLEASRILTWLQENHGTDSPYVGKLLDHATLVLVDKHPEEDEIQELRDALMEWTVDGGFYGEEWPPDSSPFDPEPRNVSIAGNSFIFAGQCLYGGRSATRQATVRGGGCVEKSIGETTDFVVIGTYATPAWASQSYGRTIEVAMDYRDRRHSGLKIVHENDWMNALSTETMKLH